MNGTNTGLRYSQERMVSDIWGSFVPTGGAALLAITNPNTYIKGVINKGIKAIYQNATSGPFTIILADSTVNRLLDLQFMSGPNGTNLTNGGDTRGASGAAYPTWNEWYIVAEGIDTGAAMVAASCPTSYGLYGVMVQFCSAVAGTPVAPAVTEQIRFHMALSNCSS